jgi:dephospho-CoA kinase
MLRVGLTGGIGSGKSTVAALFAKHGAAVIDTDAIAHQLSNPGQIAYDEIIRRFGKAILDQNRQINRSRLRGVVFDQPEQRKILEAILHPRIREEVNKQLDLIDSSYCIIVIPLLIEARFTDMVDRILVVDADETLQSKRAAARGVMSEAEIQKIMATQVDREVRLKQAHDLIVNNADVAHLETEVDRLHAYYLSFPRS